MKSYNIIEKDQAIFNDENLPPVFGDFEKSLKGQVVSGIVRVEDSKVELGFIDETFEKPIGNASHLSFRVMSEIKEIEVFCVI
jgi:hypothetical protein